MCIRVLRNLFGFFFFFCFFFFLYDGARGLFMSGKHRALKFLLGFFRFIFIFMNGCTVLAVC
jgi:hypothetical protein